MLRRIHCMLILVICCLMLCSCSVNRYLARLPKAQVGIFYDPNHKSKVFGEFFERYEESLAESVSATQFEKHTEWKIYFATNRQSDKIGKHKYQFLREDGPLVNGVCKISIPKTHEKGVVESHTRWQFWSGPDPSRHIIHKEADVLEEQQYYAQLRETIRKSKQQDLLIFVHGFNVDFEEAATRVAQLAYDLPFNGAVLFYSWPSQGGVNNYNRDGEFARQSVPSLSQFLEKLVKNLEPGTRINLLAHSMGNRVLLSAMDELPNEFKQVKPFDEVVLAAPDVSLNDFELLVPGTIDRSKRVTLYSCQHDEALKASKLVNWAHRAGDATPTVLHADLQTVDCSFASTSFLGHSYYGNEKAVLSDLFAIFKQHESITEREWLVEKQIHGQSYWVFDLERHPVEILRVGG